MDQQDKLQMTLPADPAYVGVATRGAEIFSLRRGFEPQTARKVSLALEEAILNAFELGYRGTKNEVELKMTRTTTGLKLTVQSLGLPLNPEQLPQYSPEKAGSRYDASGLSFFMVKQLMDKVSFSAHTNGQRQLSLLKHLPRPEISLPPQGQNEKRDPMAPDTDESWEVRMARPDDAEEISRLVIRAHGQVLFSEDIYYPARVEEMIRSGKMLSAVAVTPAHTVLGHAALVPMDSQGQILELTYGFVNPDFRSQGTVSQIAQTLIRHAGKKQVSALLVMAVTNHVISQKAAARLGFRECALFVATSPASAKMGEDQGSSPGRIGNIIQAQYVKQAPPIPVYLPRKHQAMIRKIYQHLGKEILPQPLTAKTVSLPNCEAEVWTESNLVEGWMLIVVSSFGSNVKACVSQFLQEALAHQLPAVQLMLPLDDPLTALTTPEFEADGFFFAGIGPGEGGREFFILQYIITPHPGWENIYVLEGMGKEIKDYVFHCSRKNQGSKS